MKISGSAAKLTLASALVSCCLAATSIVAVAQELLVPTAMKIAVVRDGRPECRTRCAEWIEIEGEITRGSAASLNRILQKIGTKKLPILLNSQGGLVSEAIMMGRLIRNKNLTVAVSDTTPVSCSGNCSADSHRLALAHDQGAFCASACVLIMAGGRKRYDGLYGRIGVHQIRTAAEATNDTPASAKSYDFVRSYLVEMGVDSDLMSLMLQAPATGTRWLSRPEMMRTKLITDEIGGQQIVADLESVTLDKNYYVQNATENAILDPPFYNFPTLTGQALWFLDWTSEIGMRTPILRAHADIPRAGLHLDLSLRQLDDRKITFLFVFTHTSSNIVADVQTIRRPSIKIDNSDLNFQFSEIAEKSHAIFESQLGGDPSVEIEKALSSDAMELHIPVVFMNNRTSTLILELGAQSRALFQDALIAWNNR